VVHFINTLTFAARDFSASRGASDEHIPKWISKEQATKSGEKELPPFGLRRILPGAALLLGHSPTGGDARSSRLAPGQIGRNERERIYEMDH